MNIHKNARLTPLRREEMAVAVIEGRLSKAEAARRYGVCVKIVSRWVERFRVEGSVGMADRSSRPKISPRQLATEVCVRIAALRRERLTARHIACETKVSPASVSRVLKRAGLSRLKDLAPADPIIRYQYAEPGCLIHFDIKRLGRFDRVGHRITGDRTGQSNSRGVGWEYFHVAIDDASRLAYTEVLTDEKEETTCAFAARAIDWFERHGLTVACLMSHNGSAYRSQALRLLLTARGIRHICTRPYTPQTNGKTDRFIQTGLWEWAYAAPYQSSIERNQAMPGWIDACNTIRPHSAFNGISPFKRLNNLLANVI